MKKNIAILLWIALICLIIALGLYFTFLKTARAPGSSRRGKPLLETIVTKFNLENFSTVRAFLLNRLDKGDDEMILDKLVKRKPPVLFPHRYHYDNLNIGCQKCHHAMISNLFAPPPCLGCHPMDMPMIGAATVSPPPPARGKKVKYVIFHRLCVRCHKTTRKGPRKCKECHDKTLVWRSGKRR